MTHANASRSKAGDVLSSEARPARSLTSQQKLDLIGHVGPEGGRLPASLIAAAVFSAWAQLPVKFTTAANPSAGSRAAGPWPIPREPPGDDRDADGGSGLLTHDGASRLGEVALLVRQ